MRDHFGSATKKIFIDSKTSVEKAKDFLLNNESKVEVGFHDNQGNEHILEKYQINKQFKKLFNLE